MNRFNASQRQAAEMYNLTLPQQEFQNNMDRINAQNAARLGVANGLDQQGQNIRTTGAGIANSAIDYGQSWDWGQKAKKDDAEKDHG